MKNSAIPFIIYFILLFLFFFLTKSSKVFSEEKNLSNPDTVGQEVVNDSLFATDFPYLFGSKKFVLGFSYPIFSKEKLADGDFLFLEDLFNNHIGIKILNLSSLGLPRPILSNARIGFANGLWNGINVGEPFYGISTFDFYPLLMFEKIEVLEGLESLVFSNSDNGVSFNYLTRNFDAKAPYTQIWIGQGGYDFLGSSAVISQNISSNLNAYFSYQRLWSAGRYQNSQSDRWNILAGTRLKITPSLSLKLENCYTNWGYGLNGGIDPFRSIDIYQNTTAKVYYEKFKRRVYQNNLNFSYLWKVLKDSTISLAGNFLLSYSLLDEEKDSSEFPYLSSKFETVSKIYHSFVTDNRFIFKSRLVGLISGVELWERKNNKLDSIVATNFGNVFFYGLVNFRLIDDLNLISGFRLGFFENKSINSFGTKLKYSVDPLSSFYLEGNYFQRIDPIKLNNNTNIQNNLLFRIGAEINTKLISFSAKGFYRNIRNYCIYESIPDTLGHPIFIGLAENINYNAIGVETEINFPLWFRVVAETRLSGYFSNYRAINKDFFPNLILQQSLKYKYQRGKSVAELGITFELVSPFTGFTYLPQWNLFARSNHNIGWQNNGLKLFANLKLGNAILNLSLNNVLSSNYYFLPIYPEYDRNLRVSLIWSFSD